MLKRNRREEGIKSLFVEREREVRSTIMDTKKKKKTKENKKCRVGERKKNKVESERERERVS